MKNLCVFYNKLAPYKTEKIHWVVCKECVKKLKKGLRRNLLARAAWELTA
jgi:hypothetical protein